MGWCVSELCWRSCRDAAEISSYLQGARQQGIKEHVKVKKKHDSTGVGAVRSYTQEVSSLLHDPTIVIALCLPKYTQV